MEIIAFQVLAQMVEYGMTLTVPVNVLIIKFGLQEHVYHHKLLVQMEEYGIQLFMHVFVKLEHIQMLTNVIQFHHALMVKFIIH